MAYHNWIFKLGILGLVSLSSAFSDIHAAKACGPALARLAGARLKETVEIGDLHKLSRALISGLSRLEGIPSAEVFAELAEAQSVEISKKTGTRAFLADLAVYANEHHTEDYKKVRRALLREAVDFFADNFREPTPAELSVRMNASVSELQTFYGPTENLFSELKTEFPKEISRAQKAIAFAYANLASKTGRSPFQDEVATAIGMSPKEFTALLKSGNLYKDFAEIKERANALRPKAFYRVIDTDVFGDARVEALNDALENRTRILYTDAVAGSPALEAFLGAMKTYCRERDGAVVVRPQNMITYGLDPILLTTDGVHIALNTWELGPNLALPKTKLTAKQINTLTGLQRIGHRGQIQIFGSPKMAIETVPTVKNSDSPHIIMSTGAVTEPYYEGPLYIQGRTDEIAAADHVMGAVIIEKDVDPSGKVTDQTRNIYRVRHIEFIPEKNGFQDLNRFYTAEGSRPAKVKMINLPDSHPGDTDPKVFASLPDLIDFLKPEEGTVEDGFNGHSLSHHTENQAITTSVLAREGKRNVNTELQLSAGQLNDLLRMNPTTTYYVKRANHNNWITQWVQEQRYVDDDVNREIGAELFLAAVRKENPMDPLEYGIRKAGLIDDKRVVFLKPGEKKAVGPKHREVWVHLHGHAGVNGSKTLSLESVRRGAGRGVFAHTHTLRRSNGAVNIGTMTNLELEYNKDGLSNWVQALSFIGENGEIQTLRFQNGRWFTPVNAKNPDPRKFFEPGFPHVHPNNLRSDGTGQLDQHNRHSGK